MTVSVNGRQIADQAILAEMQYHPAASAAEAQAKAAEALVIRELLRQAAAARGLGEGEEAIETLLELEIAVPEPDEETCRRYYENNRRRMRSTDLFEAAHILFPAPPDDDEARSSARVRAGATIAELVKTPETFGALARERSSCSSAKQDGRLGQVARGDTAPEFETFLYALEEGQISPVPVMTRYGAHVVRLDRRILGRELPYEMVRDKVAGYLRESAWRQALRQYLQILVGESRIEGIELSGATSPLVQ